MNTADMNEIMCLAMVSIESGFKRVQIDPQHVVEIIESRNKILAALKELVGRTNTDETGQICVTDLEFSACEARGIIYEADNE